ncbi:DUF2264 domain-containing protein [Streptomyces synnematoformans]|uniref:DUF2264 domain-containing protein n=1 Tax=Streptomyces synnematoformans TaxID=415721 RepID=A0ABP5J4J1_9ACTN
MSTPDRAHAAPLAPITGWTRERWTSLADGMLRAVRPYASPGHARVTLPGPPGGYGTAVDGLEGFARTFLLAGFRLAGEQGRDPDGLAAWYARGLDTGTDPGAAERWPRPDEHPQAKVEAASLALILDMTRPWLWDRLAAGVQERIVDYLAPVVGDDSYPRCNWVWFRIVVETFLRSVGGPWSAADIEADLAAHDSFYRGNGWFADGDERSFDHYGGWALHLYPVLWARMAGAAEPAAARGETDRLRLERYLQDCLHLIGGDGAPLVQGRSLIYRFAAAAPLWAGALAGVKTVRPGQLRRAASGIMAYFDAHHVPGERGLLTLGWHHEWRQLAQSYSGPSSPYWAAKGMLGIALGPDHPVWCAAEEPLPAERDDHARVVRAPGWLVSSTWRDGLVRVVNHGTDHALPGSPDGDSPLYARLGYSTATAPLLSAEAWTSPVDQSAVLLDADGRATHRTGMRKLHTGRAGDVVTGASVARAHWLDPEPGGRDHGSGRPGKATDAAAVTTVSALRGAWEVRCVRVDPLPGAPDALGAAARLRVGGWPLAGEAVDGRVQPGGWALARTARLASVAVAVEGFDDAGTRSDDGASPLGGHSLTPWLSGPVAPGRWYAAAIGLYGATGTGTGEAAAPHVRLTAGAVHIGWPDGSRTTVDLPAPEGPSRQDTAPRLGTSGAGLGDGTCGEETDR